MTAMTRRHGDGDGDVDSDTCPNVDSAAPIALMLGHTLKVHDVITTSTVTATAATTADP